MLSFIYIIYYIFSDINICTNTTHCECRCGHNRGLLSYRPTSIVIILIPNHLNHLHWPLRQRDNTCVLNLIMQFVWCIILMLTNKKLFTLCAQLE